MTAEDKDESALNVHVDAEAQEASEQLLVDTWQVLESASVGQIVVGGWVAKTFNTTLPHPGTLDVDILIPTESLESAFPKAVSALKSMDFLPSAKTTFQLSRVASIAGEEVLFHVDFLCDGVVEGALVIPRGDGTVMSIATPSMKTVLTATPRVAPVRGHIMRFASPFSFLLTKAAALGSVKRRKDAYDIFGTVAAHQEDLLQEVAQAAMAREEWQELIVSVREYYLGEGGRGVQETLEVAEAVGVSKSVVNGQVVRETIGTFVDEVLK
jgi:hypothetical protein